MMDRVQRAHIFQSFDALKGFRELLASKECVEVPRRILSEDDLEILNRKVHAIERGMVITVVYYDAGRYIKRTGCVTQIDLDQRFLQIVKTKILLKDIVDLFSTEWLHF